ncbi:MAG: hypothetical protein HOP24_11905 [Sideroxydans sp.]|nr:hypothetical protein [Sideroxydans sp.]
MKAKFAAATTLLIFSLGAGAAEVKNLLIEINNDEKSCRMVEFGYGAKENPLKFLGKWYEHNECTVHFSAEDFYKRFQHCAVSGLKNYAGKAVECRVRYGASSAKEKSGWVEFTQEKDTECEFVCVTK